MRHRPCSLVGAGCALVFLTFAPPFRRKTRDGAPDGASSVTRASRHGASQIAKHWRKDARPPALHCGERSSALFGAATSGSRSVLPGTRLSRALSASANPSPADSPQNGHNAARPGPGASRVRGDEPRPRAPHHRLVTGPKLI